MPAEYNVDGVQFAFRYVHPNEDTTGQLAIDNVKLMAVEDGPVAQKYTITATAGEGGSITPAGAVSVKEGASQTFAIAAQEGYAIADVLVDGEFIPAQHDISLRFRGSGNQRIIDLNATRAAGHTVLWQDDPLFADHKM